MCSSDLKLVSGSNECRLWVRHFPDHNKGVVFSALDNLLKGAAGQAIQNLNLMYGFDASAGLPKLASYL